MNDEVDNGQEDLNPQVKRRDLPDEVADLRLAAAAESAVLESTARTRIEAHLVGFRLVADQLERWHREVADTTDLDLDGYARPAAMWLVAGRSLGLFRALIAQIDAGICTEVMATVRSIHEASRLMFVLGQREEDALLRVWLDDEGRHGYVKPGQAREAHGRFEERLAEAMERSGVPRVRATRDLMAQAYDIQSRVAHNRRGTILDQVSVGTRQMAYGFNPDPLRRAYWTMYAATIAVEVTQYVGDAIGQFHRPGFFSANVQPLVKEINAVSDVAPLDPDSIISAASL